MKTKKTLHITRIRINGLDGWTWEDGHRVPVHVPAEDIAIESVPLAIQLAQRAGFKVVVL